MFGFGKSSIWDKDWPYFVIAGAVATLALAVKKTSECNEDSNTVSIDVHSEEDTPIKVEVNISSNNITYKDVSEYISKWFAGEGKKGFVLVRYDEIDGNYQVTIKYYNRLGDIDINNNTVLAGQIEDDLVKKFTFFNTFLVKDE